MDKVVSVKPLENSLLEIEFADGFCKVINITVHLLGKEFAWRSTMNFISAK